MLDSLHQIDNQILLCINGDYPPFWDCFMWIISAKETWIVMYISLFFILLRNFSLRVSLMILVGIILTLVFTDQVCASVIRPMAERMRPSNINNPISKYVYLVNGYRGGSYGMPSCHSANTFGLAFMMILIMRNKILSTALLLWACLNCYSRMHLGVHYLGDLLCGMLVALVGAMIIYHLMRYVMNIESVRTAVKINEHDINLLTHKEEFSKCFIPVAVLLLTIIAVALYAEFIH